MGVTPWKILKDIKILKLDLRYVLYMHFIPAHHSFDFSGVFLKGGDPLGSTPEYNAKSWLWLIYQN